MTTFALTSWIYWRESKYNRPKVAFTLSAGSARVSISATVVQSATCNCCRGTLILLPRRSISTTILPRCSVSIINAHRWNLCEVGGDFDLSPVELKTYIRLGFDACQS